MNDDEGAMTRRLLLKGSAALTILPATASARARPDGPSFLLLLPDQLRPQALSVYGERNITTPIFDGLIGRSAHFPLAYCTNPVCSPSRASLWTGMYPHATGVRANGPQLPLESQTLSTVLSEAGYLCGYIGKWHLDQDKERPGYVPRERRFGFKWWAAHNIGHSYRDAGYYRNSRRMRRPDPPDRFEPEAQVDLAFEFLDKARNRPFFLVMAFGPPHAPGSAPIKDWSKDLPPGALRRVDKEALTLNPNVPAWKHGPNRGPDGSDDPDPGVLHHMQGYYASILALEDAVQRLLDGLRDRQLVDQTVVMLTSDHGENGGAHGQYKKGEPFEEAVRVPLSFQWKGRIPPRALPPLASGVDVFPTVLGLAGVPASRKLHGNDLSPWLLRGDGRPQPTAMAQGKMRSADEWRLLRTERHSLVVRTQGGPTELFDNDEDPFQMRDLAGAPGNASLIASLEQQLEAARAAVRDRRG